MKRIAIFLTERQVKKLREYAQGLGIPMAEMLRRLLDDGLRRIERERRREQ